MFIKTLTLEFLLPKEALLPSQELQVGFHQQKGELFQTQPLSCFTLEALAARSVPCCSL